MKRFILSTLLLAMVLLTGAPFAFAQSPTAVIRELTGTVELKRPGSAAWAAANPGDRIDKSTIISTGFKSSATLVVGSSTLLVRPVTRLSLEDLLTQNETETINISLSTGRVRVEVPPAGARKSNFTVQSPSAIASVRGTSFEFDTTSIRVLEGTVSYASVDGPAARPVKVGAGEESWVDTDTNIAVDPMAAAEINRPLPDLPGEYAGTLSDNIRLASPDLRPSSSADSGAGSFDVDVNF